MKLKINQFKVSVYKKDIPLNILLSKKYYYLKDNIKEIIVCKESIDARDKNNIFLVYNLIIELKKELSNIKYDKYIEEYKDKDLDIKYPKYSDTDRPIIVGFGPASMFSALYLSRCGAKPIIVERGSKIDERISDVEKFLKTKIINKDSNVQFGEGGAGTFSDGKLTTSLNSPLIKFIIKEFVLHGAPSKIIYESMPHIGTDYLRKVVKNIRVECESLGATFYFNTKFLNFEKDKDILKVKLSNNLTLETKHLLLGFGHSARDTIEMLYKNGCEMTPKSFSMGVRIEHKKDNINYAQYKDFKDVLSPAYYKLSTHLSNGRGVYTFCMCPGGEIMASASEDKTIVTNGMSYFKRDKENSNSGVLVSVDPKDYYKNSPLDGIYYQEYYEKKAFEISNDYKAPANLVKEFLEGGVAKEIRSVTPTYPHGVYLTKFDTCLPPYVIESLREALPIFDKKLNGFAYPDAVLTGIETRSSSPIRMIREEDRMSNIKGIYPIGEGPGYAGGITSAALDGLKSAIYIVEGSYED